MAPFPEGPQPRKTAQGKRFQGTPFRHQPRVETLNPGGQAGCLHFQSETPLGGRTMHTDSGYAVPGRGSSDSPAKVHDTQGQNPVRRHAAKAPPSAPQRRPAAACGGCRCLDGTELPHPWGWCIRSACALCTPWSDTLTRPWRPWATGQTHQEETPHHPYTWGSNPHLAEQRPNEHRRWSAGPLDSAPSTQHGYTLRSADCSVGLAPPVTIAQ